MTAADILASCDASLKRLKTDVIDLYQIHWPERHVPIFGAMYYDPTKEKSATPIHEQLDTLAGLVKAGKVRAIGLSNETPYGVHEFVRLAEQHGLPRVATVQNPYCLVNRTWENGLDETCHRLGVSLLAYSHWLLACLLASLMSRAPLDRMRLPAHASPPTSPCANSAGAVRRPWSRRAATTNWRATTA
jgi:aryl-alcohol dehydrogenase-like predicted oxidoreductase